LNYADAFGIVYGFRDIVSISLLFHLDMNIKAQIGYSPFFL